ncbi:MAG: hypothetical protein KGV56_05425 [Gammaproteobacteria bacterium]|nr:hypothetical protein [Gammaproteobacteria bacterium]
MKNIKSILFNFLGFIGVQRMSAEEVRQLLAIAEEQTYTELDHLYEQLEKEYNNYLNADNYSDSNIVWLKTQIENVNTKWEQLKSRYLPLIEQDNNFILAH